ncbi:centrosomal protein of 162 kDa [Centropristis striata]|uniref:centrosomal protein of 162 kDa n=1 Tax=Centropristis striata TaxID=184440 RepID=UPI0027E1933D|nr:centrosomal protein of 162 kDa [Centropristis striata]
MSHRLTKEQLDEEFELFLKESVSDDSDKQPGAKSSHKPAQKPTVSWWKDDKHSAGGTGRGLLGSGKTFRKSLGRSVGVEDEDAGDTGSKEDSLEAAVLSRNNLVKIPAAETTALGLDTIEEEEEKAKFFAQLEAAALTTIDYSKLNRELDSTSSTTGTTHLREAEEVAEQSNGDPKKSGVTETVRESPAFAGFPNYSEDFEEEENQKEPRDEEPKMSPILAKVSLHDSLDDTGRDNRRKDAAGSLDKGQSYVQSGGSEMEALHEAYRQIHVVEDSDDHNPRYSFLKGTERTSRPVFPSSPPPHSSLQHASTNESELPTAEELMRPIQPEKGNIRGFTLHPVSAAGLDGEKTPSFLETAFSDVTSPESQLKQPEKADCVQVAERGEGLTRPPSSPPEPLNLTRSIRQEVERLMQDHNKYSPYTSSEAGKAKKQQASHGSTTFHSSTSSLRKPTVASVRGRRPEGRAASRLSGAAAKAQTQSAAPRPRQHPQEKPKFTKSQEKDEYTEPDVKVSSELVASVQSLVAVIQQQVDISSHQDPNTQNTRQTLPHPNNKREDNGSVVEELRVQLAEREKELQMMKGGAEELNSLRRQNYVLQSKLQSAEEASQKRKRAEATDSAAEEKLKEIEKEIKEQETLIKGYQQENEKLFLQVKAQQVKSKTNEEAMFQENQRLLNELAFTREQLYKTPRMDHTQRITDLLAQVNMFQRTEAKLSEDIHRLKQEKQTLQVDLLLMKKERDVARAQAVSASGDKTLEQRVLEDEHREGVSALQKKLQRFAENQKLLDRDAGRLKAATAEIRQLKEQVEKLKMDVGKRSSEQQRKLKEKTADTKRMQELQQQVKDLKQIPRSRNQNSLHAAKAGSQDDLATRTPLSRINALLERRVQSLEAELESHDEKTKSSLLAMEQQFHRVKLHYEQQITELEQLLEQKGEVEAADPAAGAEPWRSQVQTLEEELQSVRENHQEKEKSLQDQIESLQQQLKQKILTSPGRHQRQAEAAFGSRIQRLEQDLASKTRSVQELSRTVERLQKERKNMLSVSNQRAETRSTETKRPPGQTRTPCPAAAETFREEETFPDAHHEKTYQPTVFTGSHISEVQQENEALKQRLKLLELQTEQEREALKAEAVQAKEELCRLKELSAEQLSSVKEEHLRVLDQLSAIHALEHSSSKFAELANKLNAHEVMVKHLQDKLKEGQGDKNALAISRTRQDALQKQLTRLLKELKEAKESQSPEVKILCSLEKKILNMELRHQVKEKQMQQVIDGSWQTLEADQQSEVESWKRLAQDKSRELEAFRLELDFILDILRHLQRQGVVFPNPDPSTTVLLTQRS